MLTNAGETGTVSPTRRIGLCGTTQRRTHQGWVRRIRGTPEQRYRQAERVVLGFDNLKTHYMASLHASFAPDHPTSPSTAAASTPNSPLSRGPCMRLVQEGQTAADPP